MINIPYFIVSTAVKRTVLIIFGAMLEQGPVCYPSRASAKKAWAQEKIDMRFSNWLGVKKYEGGIFICLPPISN